MKIEFKKKTKKISRDFDSKKLKSLINACFETANFDSVDYNKIWIYDDLNNLFGIIFTDIKKFVKISDIQLFKPDIKKFDELAIKAIKYLYAAHTDEYNHFGAYQSKNTTDEFIDSYYTDDNNQKHYIGKIRNRYFGLNLKTYNTQQFIKDKKLINEIIRNISNEQEDLKKGRSYYERYGYSDKINRKTFEDLIFSSAIKLDKDTECYRVWGAFTSYNLKNRDYKSTDLVSASLKYDKHYEQKGNKAERYILPKGTYIIKFDDVFFADSNEILCFANDLKQL